MNDETNQTNQTNKARNNHMYNIFKKGILATGMLVAALGINGCVRSTENSSSAKEPAVQKIEVSGIQEWMDKIRNKGDEKIAEKILLEDTVLTISAAKLTYFDDYSITYNLPDSYQTSNTESFVGTLNSQYCAFTLADNSKIILLTEMKKTLVPGEMYSVKYKQFTREQITNRELLMILGNSNFGTYDNGVLDDEVIGIAKEIEPLANYKTRKDLKPTPKATPKVNPPSEKKPTTQATASNNVPLNNMAGGLHENSRFFNMSNQRTMNMMHYSMIPIQRYYEDRQ